MPVDRAAALKNAEKLLRQGKLDAAIAEYARIVDEHPRDWNTANILGDLYVRGGQTDKAVPQFNRIADHLNEEGFLPKAAALYKKVLKLRPDDEHALVQAAEIASSQGLLADARTYLNAIGDLRLSRGDRRGAAQARIRLGSLDPADFEARAGAARARIEIGDASGAVADFKAIATELAEKGRATEAVDALRHAAEIDPNDEDIRERLLQVYVASGDFTRARQCASTVEQFKRLSAALSTAGHEDAALDALVDAARLDPSLSDLREHLAKAFIARGNLQAAAEYLTEETAGGDPKLLLMVAELHLRAGRVDEGLAIVHRLLAEDPSRSEQIAMMSWDMAGDAPEPAFRVAEVAADASIAASDWASAAATLQEFVTRVPNHIPSLMRLVEVCVDGGLEATMYSAQAQLADAYISAGSAAEARVIAEDLVAREPWERANIERFRRALVLMGEKEPDALIADRLSGQSPFMTTDLAVDLSDIPFEPDEPAAPVPLLPQPAPAARTPAAPPKQAKPRAATPPAANPQPASPKPATPRPAPAPAPPEATSKGISRNADEKKQFGLGVNAIDLAGILGELESDAPPSPPTRAAHEHVEVDLSVVLEDITPSPPAPGPAPSNIDDVFAHIRDDASRQSALGAAEAQYKRGAALHAAGRADEAVPELEAASRTPRFRFVAASLLGRIHLARGRRTVAIEWLERAAQAPPPTPAEGHQLLYELADALEAEGETARALAVCLELQTDAGDFRDVAARVDRLARVQTGG